MNGDILQKFFSLFITAVSYMAIPILLDKKKGPFNKKDSFRIALANSILVNLGFIIYRVVNNQPLSAIFSTTAIFYFIVNLAILRDWMSKKPISKAEYIKNTIILWSIILAIFVLTIIYFIYFYQH